jgi:hypothetical protein
MIPRGGGRESFKQPINKFRHKILSFLLAGPFDAF